jgi:hypothetical protein
MGHLATCRSQATATGGCFTERLMPVSRTWRLLLLSEGLFAASNEPVAGAGFSFVHQGFSMRSFTLLPVLLFALASASTFAADAVERKFIRKGMGEGEVVLKIGKPDHEAINRAVRGAPEEKTWTYFPHARDPQTLTVLTFHSGLVTKIDRKIAR